MKTKTKQIKKYVCKFCKIQSEIVGIAQKEERFYKYYLDTKQWEDFSGSENVESQKLFCINCNKTIKDLELD
jgi:hypothetical protein